MLLQRLLVLIALVGIVAGRPLPAHSQGLPGRASLNGQEATFDPPLGFWTETGNRVSVAYFTTAPSAAQQAASRAAGKWDVTGTGPTVLLEFAFTPGSASALVEQLVWCRVSFHGFKTPLELTGTAKDCLVVSIGGLLRENGALIGLVEGKGPTYALRLPFSIAFANLATTTAAAAAPSSPARAAAPPPAAVSAIPLNTVSGSALHAGQTLTFTHGFAWWVAIDNEVRLALFDHAPPASMLAEVRSGSWGEGGPTMTITVRLKPGAALAPEAVTYCYVDGAFPKGGSIAFNVNSAARCGLTNPAGDPRADGTFAAQLKGEGPGPNDRPFSWDVRFNLPIAR